MERVDTGIRLNQTIVGLRERGLSVGVFAPYTDANDDSVAYSCPENHL